jgi:hypothetical protein
MNYDYKKILMTGAALYFGLKILPRPVVFLGVITGTYLITQQYKETLAKLQIPS